MKIGVKFGFMVGIPIVAIGLILVIGILSFSGTKQLVAELSVTQNDRSTMIDADRDAYQAFLAVRDTVNAKTEDEIRALQDTSTENFDQTWERITGPGEHFTDEFTADFTTFQDEYVLWREESDKLIQFALATSSGNQQRDLAAASAIQSFGAMRDLVDVLGADIFDGLAGDLTLARRRQLEDAMSLVLNADRDAYQAYVAQLLVLDAATTEELESLSADHLENAQQTYDRVRAGADLVGASALDMKTQFEQSYQIWYQASRNVVDLSKQNFEKNAAIAGLSVQSVIHFQAMRDAIDRLGESQKARVEREIAAVNDSISQTLLIYIIIAAIAIAITLVIVSITALRITRAIIKCVDFSDRIAKGDLSVDLEVQQKDELGTLADSLRDMLASVKYKANIVEQVADGNLRLDVDLASEDDGLGHSLVEMVSSLNEVLGQTRQAAEQVTSGASQVSQASQSLSQGATEQASSLEEISSSLSQINGQSRQNADNAVEANSLAQQAVLDAEGGNEKMKELVDAMERINASSDEIGKVVKVIDDIAFQINLLALNANVEAARAGKYGKGFAVVAEEVRNLAVRSAEAVKETTDMVDETMRNITGGTKSAEETARQLEAIVDGSNKVANLLGEISLASSEQAQGVEQIDSGLEQIDQVTQANTASAEESASASEELSGQAQQLRSMIERFRLNGASSRNEREALPSFDDSETLPVPAGQSAVGERDVVGVGSSNGNGESKSTDPNDVIHLDDKDFGEF